MNREEIIINEVRECIKAYKKRPMCYIDGKYCIALDNDDINRISYKCAFWILIKEKNLLKEFVEWLKENFFEKYVLFAGKQDDVDKLIENFLKENE